MLLPASLLSASLLLLPWSGKARFELLLHQPLMAGRPFYEAAHFRCRSGAAGQADRMMMMVVGAEARSGRDLESCVKRFIGFDSQACALSEIFQFCCSLARPSTIRSHGNSTHR
jgi:hypothetical protein